MFCAKYGSGEGEKMSSGQEYNKVNNENACLFLRKLTLFFDFAETIKRDPKQIQKSK